MIITDYRKRHRLTQKALAGYLQVDQASIAHWEKGHTPSGPAFILLSVLSSLDVHPSSATVSDGRAFLMLFPSAIP